MNNLLTTTNMPLSLRVFQKIISTLPLPGRYVLAAWIAKRYQSKYPIVNGHVGKYEVKLNLNDVIQQQVYFQIYDRHESQLLPSLLSTNDVFIDVGANIGYYSLLASQLVGPHGQVIAFEPIPELSQLLSKTINDNKIINLTVVPCAVGANAGNVILYIGPGMRKNSGSASIVPSTKRPEQLSVPIISLDEYVIEKKIGGVRLVKIDIEGGELDALKGANLLLSSNEGPDLIIEINPYLLNRQNYKPQLFLNMLIDLKYHLFTIDKNKLLPVSANMPIKDTINIFCTKLPGKYPKLIQR